MAGDIRTAILDKGEGVLKCGERVAENTATDGGLLKNATTLVASACLGFTLLVAAAIDIA